MPTKTKTATRSAMSGLEGLGAIGQNANLARVSPSGLGQELPEMGVPMVLQIGGAAIGGAVIGGVSSQDWYGASIGALLTSGLVALGDAAALANKGQHATAMGFAGLGIVSGGLGVWLATLRK